MGYFANRRERRERKRIDAELMQGRRDAFWSQWHSDCKAWNERYKTAWAKAEAAAERADGNTALAWIALAQEMTKNRPAMPPELYE